MLRELKTAKALNEGGLTPTELSERVAATREMSVQYVREVLSRLSKKSDAAGPDVALLTMTEGRWRIGNV